MEADQGVKEKKLRPQARKRSSEPRLVPPGVETKDGRGDDQKIKRAYVEAAIVAQALESSPHLSECVFCEINERGTADLDFEVSQGRSARSNAYGEV